MVQLENDEKEIEKERSEVKNNKRHTYDMVIELIDYLKDIYNIYVSASQEGKKDILAKLVDETIVNEDGTFQIFWKPPIKYLVRNEILEYKIKVEGIKKKFPNKKFSETSPRTPRNRRFANSHG